MQAARGASLSSSDPGTKSARVSSRLIFAVAALVGLTIDQVSKAWALANLGDQSRPVIGDWFTLYLTFNPGAAFSTGTRFTVVFTALAIIAVGVILFLSRRLGSRLWALGLGLLLAGVAGNLTDRIFRDPAPFRGHVIDFLRVPNFPVFNVADIFINVAAAVIILQSIRGVSLDGTRHDEDRSAPEAGE